MHLGKKVTKVCQFPVREWGGDVATWWHSPSTVQYQAFRIIALLHAAEVVDDPDLCEMARPIALIVSDHLPVPLECCLNSTY